MARFQAFDDSTDPTASGPRLAALRAELSRRGLSGLVVPRADRHQNEYVPPSDERLSWLTGFTGSAGLAIVLADRAVLFVDGRYTLQAAEQVDGKLFEIVHLADGAPDKWIESKLGAGLSLGYDPWLHTIDGAEKYARACVAAGSALVALDDNPLDAVWADRPAPPLAPVVLHDLRFAGEPAAAKLARVAAEIRKTRADALVVADPHALAWLFNIRGADVAHTPVALGFAIVPADGRPTLHLDRRKLADGVRDALAGIADLRGPEAFADDVAALGAQHRGLLVDPAITADAIGRLLAARGGRMVRGKDPIAAMKAVKNAAEIAGAHAAHLRDGAALTRFLAWFDRHAGTGTLTEIDAVTALEDFRSETGRLKDVSFPTIAGAGPNGAIVHYRVTKKTNRTIAPGDLFLIDSGAQYEDGTTDVTRTVAVGAPTAEMSDRFTRVLKGPNAVARAVFPHGTTGAQIDSFARSPLWSAGLDFDHGTGHGVGSYLSVHEGPARISKLGATALERGMILSNEPGYYKRGAYGIRIENLLLVAAGPQVAGGEKELDGFETLTLAPIDRRLVAAALMTADEIAWLDAYHRRVRDALSPLVDTETRAWLDAATAPLA